MQPRAFFEQYIQPTIAEWRADPLDIRKATVAMCQLDIIADHITVHQNPGKTGDELRRLQAKERKRQDVCPLRLLIRDIHDTHKHGPLGRDTATIKTGRRPERVQRPGAFSDAFSDAFDIDRPALEIVQDNGARTYIEDLIIGAVAYWDAELSRMGL